MFDAVAQPSPVADSLLSHGNATPARVHGIVGYARTPFPGTALDRRIAELTASGCRAVYSDAAVGAAIIRPGLDAALAALRPGDVLAVASLALLSWRLDGLGPILSAVKAAGAHVVAEAERLDTRSADDFFDTMRILDAFSVSVRAARKAEASSGRRDNRRRIDEEAWNAVEPLLSSGEISVNETARRLGVNRSTVYRRVESGV